MRRALVAVAVAVFAVAGCSAVSTTTAGRPAVPVSDGDLEFAVLGVDRTKRVGDASDPGLSVDARGVFVVITLSIRNAGDTAIIFIDRYQKLIDDRGRAFDVSNAADIYGNRDVPSTKIQPGDGLVVRLAFDVPVDTVPASITLHESETSPGVTVQL